MDLTTLVIAMSIPSAITGFCFWMIERKIKQRDDEEKAEREEKKKAQAERDERRREYETCLLNMSFASMALAEATARAVERIPDTHCNGDMHKALEYADKVKNEQRDFLRKQAIYNLDL